MKSSILLITLFLASFSQDDRTANFPKSIEKVKEMPKKENVWVFLMAGQSNMAGRGFVEPMDTLSDKRVLSINKDGELIYAKEPLHFNEPSMAGLDCGLSFGKTVIENIPDSISVLLIPTAVGGSSVSQWLYDSLYRNIQLLSNFKAKATLAKKYGQIKGILWHQGESDANPKGISEYKLKLSSLFKEMRAAAGNNNLPIFIGELGSYSTNNENWRKINRIIKEVSKNDDQIFTVPTYDLKHKGDKVHFNSEGQRTMGRRMAAEFLSSLQ